MIMMMSLIMIITRPITRLFYNSDQTSLYSCSYDKTVKRLDMDSMKFETIFKADSARFDSEVFLHHCTPDPNQEHLFYISLGNGYDDDDSQ